MDRVMLLCAVFLFMGLYACHGLKIDAPVMQKLQAGTTDTVRCKATVYGGEAIGSTEWKKRNFRPVREGVRYTFTEEGLTIRNVQPKDGGLYVCEIHLSASNNHGHGMIYQKFIVVEVV